MLSFKQSIATIRGDLSNITAPPFVLDTKSAVELPSFWAERPSIFVAPVAAQDPAERALLVLKWFLSSLRNQQYAGRSPAEGVKKPINAFLGELFLARWEDDDDDRDGTGVTRLVSEQVSHHPPVTACRVWNEKHGVTAEGYTRQEITFSGNVNIQQIGHATLHLAHHNETYLVPLPNIKIKGLLTGSPYPELQGTHHIPCTSGYTSTIDFSGRGLFSGADRKHSFEARVYRDDRHSDDDEEEGHASPIYTVSGHWDGQFVIRDPRQDIELETFDVTTAATTPLVTDPITEQDPWESRRAWCDVREALQRGDMQGAADAKARVENGQREMRKTDGDGADWQRLFFQPGSRASEVAVSLAQKVGLVLNPEDTVAAWSFRRDEWDGGRLRRPYHGDLRPDNSHATGNGIGGATGTGTEGEEKDDIVVNGVNGGVPSPSHSPSLLPTSPSIPPPPPPSPQQKRHQEQQEGTPDVAETETTIDSEQQQPTTMTAREKTLVEHFLRDRYSSRRRA
ncbi:Protein kes1 [Fonsecaea pedrosoi]|nr:Protein kes1 [Fonsecaea pedrosoi]